jgi:hypothetical protein
VPFHEEGRPPRGRRFLDEEDTAGEGFVVSGNEIDLEELALRILSSSLPIRSFAMKALPSPKVGKAIGCSPKKNWPKKRLKKAIRASLL